MGKNKSKKHSVLEELYKHCISENTMQFHSENIKKISNKFNFGNPFDATKLDSSNKLPQFMLDKDLCILHLGKGHHKFINGIKLLYHQFEPIEKVIKWKYRKSLLNEYNDSESNILSVANNQRILHDFVFGDDLEFENLPIDKRPKTYFPHRTKASLNYKFDTENITCENQQIEIVLTIEYNGTIAIFEAKNGNPLDFNICQLYNPYLYYHQAFPKNKIIAIYLVRNNNSLKLWAYKFKDPLQLNSIEFIKSSEYILDKNLGE